MSNPRGHYPDIVLPAAAMNDCSFCGGTAVRFIWTDLYPKGYGYLAACAKCCDPDKAWEWTPAVSVEVGDEFIYRDRPVPVDEVTADHGLINVWSEGRLFVFEEAEMIRLIRKQEDTK